jgi:hypothetical protein
MKVEDGYHPEEPMPASALCYNTAEYRAKCWAYGRGFSRVSVEEKGGRTKQWDKGRNFPRYPGLHMSLKTGAEIYG